MKSDKLAVNREIKSHRVILVDSEGNKKGEFLRNDAIRLAEDEGLDLVALGGTPERPVCRIMDYGKFIYSQKKKFKNNVSAQTKMKEIKIGFVSDDNYVSIKTKQAEKFLKSGNKVKVTVRFKGRESAHIGMIIEKCLGVYSTLEKIANMDSEPKRSGRQVCMVLSPRKDIVT